MKVVRCVVIVIATVLLVAGCSGDSTEKDTGGSSDTTSSDTTPVDTTPVDTAPPPPKNKPPVATDDLVETTGKASVEIKALYNDIDPDNDNLNIVEVTQGKHGVVGIVLNGTKLNYTPIVTDPMYVGMDSFTYTITDHKGGQDTGTVTVNIKAALPPPTLKITSPKEGAEISGDITVEFEVTNCNFVHPSNDKDGCHGHSFIDNKKSNSVYTYAPYKVGKTNPPVGPGEHTIILQLFKNDGTDGPFSPAVQDKVTFTLK